MIVCKPKINTYLSIGLFELLAGGLVIFIYFQLPGMGSWRWLGHMLIPVLIGIMLAILVKVLWSVKTVKVAKEKFEVNFPLRGKKRSYSGKNLKRWSEQAIKTAGGTYKEATLLFDDGQKVGVSQQEHTDYTAFVKYMNQKFARVKT